MAAAAAATALFLKYPLCMAENHLCSLDDAQPCGRLSRRLHRCKGGAARLGGQRDGEAGALAGLAARLDRAAVRFDVRLDEAQPESETAFAAARIRAVEPIPDARE